MTGNRDADSRSVTELVERRWTRYGHDRVYVTTPEGVDCGHVDLKNRLVVARQAEFENVLRECLSRWRPDDRSMDTMAGEGVLPVEPDATETSLASATAVDQSVSATPCGPGPDQPAADVD